MPLDATFRDSNGHTLALRDLFDDSHRPVILHLVYFECPMLCRLAGDGLLASLSSLSLKLGADYRVVTISFDPREGPELAARAKQMAPTRLGADRATDAAVADAWHFLTGDEQQIRRVCDAVGFHYAYDEARGQYVHASGVFLLTPDGRLSRFLSGVDFSPRDLRLGLVDASASKIGTATDQLMLLCYMYDPTAGKYGFAIFTALRIGGGMTVAALAGFIVVMLRRERRHASAAAGPEPPTVPPPPPAAT